VPSYKLKEVLLRTKGRTGDGPPGTWKWRADVEDEWSQAQRREKVDTSPALSLASVIFSAEGSSLHKCQSLSCWY
jgi:hypothetical protein